MIDQASETGFDPIAPLLEEMFRAWLESAAELAGLLSEHLARLSPGTHAAEHELCKNMRNVVAAFLD